MILVQLGNPAPTESYRPGHESKVPIEVGEQPAVTSVEFDDSTRMPDAFTSITAATGIWTHHADHQVGDDGHTDGPPPLWVASSFRPLADLLGAHYGCPVRDLDTSITAPTRQIAEQMAGNQDGGQQ